MLLTQTSSWKAYLELTKPRIWALLVFTFVVTLLIAARESQWSLAPHALALGLSAVTAGAAGCEAVTGYLERDIDGRMLRTRSRPVPSGRISPPQRALRFGLLLLAVSLASAALVNPLTLLLLALAILDNIVVYTLWSKRKSALNIVLGSYSGGAPALMGWTTVTGSLDPLPLMAAALVMAWTPWHIWSLAYYFREDYRSAGVPMLPVVAPPKASALLIAASAAVMVFVTALTPFISGLGVIFFAVSLALALPVAAGVRRLIKRLDPGSAWRMFKFSGPYLMIVFIAMLADSYLGMGFEFPSIKPF